MPFPQSGCCRCGATRFEVAAPPVLTAACHCRGCQRMSSSAYSLTAMFPADAFRVTSGSPVRGGLQGGQLTHYCCPACKSWMFTRITEVPDFVNVRPTLLEDAGWFRPYIETMTGARLPWAEVPAEHSYEGFPDMEEFGRLLQQFGGWFDSPERAGMG
ncbi:GFA family protein [Leisingera thetidis]|uniref:GFA family protein n=1 Tax=Leisingera thetidis TaxID=2930199 RepID=UPI0033137723